jgi:acyl-CoA synthetase (AMP-forming)/AMP-acid ligase II
MPHPTTAPQTVHDAFATSAARTPGAPFLCVESVTAATYGIAAGEIGWAAAAGEIRALRARYAEAGYGHGHRVGLLLENRPAFLYHWLALNALGASVVPINSEMRSAELEYLVGHSGIALAVVLPGRGADLQAAAAKAGVPLATHEWQEATVGSGSVRASAPAFPRALQAAPKAAQPVGGDTECALLYTSGTTGRPKGCMLSNAYFLNVGRWYADIGDVCSVRPDRERIITPLPLNHVNAMAFSAMAILVAGGCLVQLDRFHPQTWWQSVRESRATIIHYLGVMPAMLIVADAGPADRVHEVRWGFGAGVDHKNHAAFEARFGFPLIEAWAMTETGAGGVIMATREPRLVGTHCFGRPEPFVDVRLVDDEGRDVPHGTPGELLVRATGPDPRRHFFSGYLKDEAATEEAWADGWFHTGDMVRGDADANLFFVDRKKNVIRRSGENISAVEVESVLNQHPAVKASAVAAAPDELRGDEVLACIVTRERVPEAQRAQLAASLVDHALGQLAYFKAPGYVAFVDELPLTLSQKIQRGELRKMAQALPGDACCIDTRSMKKRQG